MARDVEIVQTISETAGLEVVQAPFVTANGGQYDNSDGTANMYFSNTDASAKTITISTDRVVTDQEVATTSATFTLPATTVIFIVPALLNSEWAQQDTTNVYVDVDDDTGVTWGVAKPG